MHHTLRVRISESGMDVLEALACETEQVGIEIRDHSLKPLPGAEPLLEGMADMVLWFETEDASREAAELVKADFPDAALFFETVEDQDWSEGWKKDVRATRAGRLWVGPSWMADSRPDDCVGLVIDPGMAFGTGDHPTTAMCMEAISDWMDDKNHEGCSVLDVGTGSGILAMAARKLGSGPAVANDIDPQAVEIARENAAKNGVDGVEWTTKPLERIRGRFDLVLANIFANVLCHYAPRLADAVADGGRLMLTGILNEQAEEVLAAFEREEMKLVRRRDRGEWTLLEMAH